MFGLGLVFLFLIIIIPIFDIASIVFRNQDAIVVGVVTGFIASIVATFIYTRYQYISAFNRLCKEIDDNHTKILPEKISEQFDKMRRKAREGLDPADWIGFEKIISIFVMVLSDESLGKDQYRYLSSNEFKMFIIHGYNTKLSYNLLHPLTLFYFYCDAFSIREQDFEKPLNHEVRVRYPERVIQETEVVISKIHQLYTANQNQLNSHYNAIKDHFQQISVLDIEKWLFL